MSDQEYNRPPVFCAVCHETIDCMDDAFVQWLSRRDKSVVGGMAAFGLRVVHHLSASPLRHERRAGCYYPDDNPEPGVWVKDHHLRAFPDGGRRLARRYGWEDTLAVVETIEPAYAALRPAP